MLSANESRVWAPSIFYSSADVFSSSDLRPTNFKSNLIEVTLGFFYSGAELSTASPIERPRSILTAFSRKLNIADRYGAKSVFIP